MSKSGVFAHFGSREELQISVVREYHQRFEQEVFFPALKQPRGLPRLRAMFANWMKRTSAEIDSGCIYISGAVEFDDRTGPVRDALADSVNTWLAAMYRASWCRPRPRATCAPTPTQADRVRDPCADPGAALRGPLPALARFAGARQVGFDNILARSQSADAPPARFRLEPAPARAATAAPAERPRPNPFPFPSVPGDFPMPTYTPPLRDMQFVHARSAEHHRRAQGDARHAEIDADTINAILEEGGKFAAEVIFPLNISGDEEGCVLDSETHDGEGAQGLQGGLREVRRRRLAGAGLRPGLRRPGPALRRQPVRLRDAQLGQPGLDHVPGPVARRLRGARRARHRRAEEDLPAQAGERRMDRHHVPDRAALRHRPGPAAHQGRAAAGRQLQAQRQQDLHLGRRARHGRQHHPPGAGPPAGRAQGQQGHQPVRGAEVQRQARRLARQPQRRSTAAASSTRWASTATPPRRS